MLKGYSLEDDLKNKIIDLFAPRLREASHFQELRMSMLYVERTIVIYGCHLF
jgi:hypothetical protein